MKPDNQPKKECDSLAKNNLNDNLMEKKMYGSRLKLAGAGIVVGVGTTGAAVALGSGGEATAIALALVIALGLGLGLILLRTEGEWRAKIVSVEAGIAIGAGIGIAVGVGKGAAGIGVFLGTAAISVVIETYFQLMRAPNKNSLDVSQPSNIPPKTAKYLLYLVVPRKNRDALLGDLEEDFNEVLEKFGLKHAKFHYWVQTFRSIPPQLTASLIGSVVKYFKSTT
ncbi:permease prefix domain 2-containing transporter [Methylovulum psychrotolerans]|uniref:Uncharacterized protein n=1 Tax=Methylovulum psychrotolerans TaxID=1704499 RepID=A0A1Z4C4Q5_9GAMM|nr:permease prefix domain 2-containing transporter [Methylovulum psychrotolerans]ASF48521.1 hypothetical protein CEK71_22055 [Methylovulum psychrotolerans]